MNSRSRPNRRSTRPPKSTYPTLASVFVDVVPEKRSRQAQWSLNARDVERRAPSALRFERRSDRETCESCGLRLLSQC